MTYIFSIEGNIGSGKSTIINNLKKTLYNLNHRKVIYLPEPVDVWESIKDSSGKNIIECYYENQQENAFSFQMMAYISRIHQLRTAIKNNSGSIIITERVADHMALIPATHEYDSPAHCPQSTPIVPSSPHTRATEIPAT